MTVESRLLSVLACPVCVQPLQLGADEARLICQGPDCGRGYRIVDGIPVLIADEALASDSVSGSLDA
ncbi:Trm112 family protein [Streptomyces sp. 4503]|uniref:Trm112 family protein n=2 Tax=Streptomyces niphimycinicus TaxID=2842201 RepID=A0ABS6CLV7_9ACTN|nr:Trm112 family protein [Streptomyces niphimycinicus]MBU3867675.1 Trm112 family protein [Streptomyces niphimycinicus]